MKYIIGISRLNILGLGMMIHLVRNAKNHHFDPPPPPPLVTLDFN